MQTLEALRAGHLKGSKRLNLTAELAQFPAEILDLADTLEILDLSHNHLTSLPDDFGRLRRLRIAFFSNNNFESIPAVLSRCPSLAMVGFKSNWITEIAENALPPYIRWLILTDNRLEELPATFGGLSRLQKLMLAGNQLRSLPDSMAACQNLELVRLSANQLPDLPSWLFDLPRLAWLAYAGNPCCSMRLPSTPSLTEIDWADLSIQNTLGEGASGMIYQGTWGTASTQLVDVAIKVFKGPVTSDGFPVDEMSACVAAGIHPNLVRLLGQVIHHPEHKAGLVFAFVPPAYRVLGHPPSLDSCTRDTYPSSTTFSLPVILQIARGIAAAAAHLKSRGILHGDLYAHNILFNAAGESLLGDFGAASFYPDGVASSGQSLESLEVRAFGCLLEDLLEHCPMEETQPQTDLRAQLHGLQHDCLNPIPSMRPPFAQINTLLTSLA